MVIGILLLTGHRRALG
ncbi:hypothetical protein [Nonomuraea sp. bgisy101]